MNREELELTPTTESASASSPSPVSSALQIHYTVAMPKPETHLFEVTLIVKGWQRSTLDLRMPVWTPGSYLVREYARHVQDFTAESGLLWQKISKNHWQIRLNGKTEATIRYRVYANELSVRTNHLDSTHGYFNGAALFFYIPGFEKTASRVTIVLPPSWQVTTPLPPTGQANTFQAQDFDTLVDSPFEIGRHQVHPFKAVGKLHELAVWGEGNLEVDRLLPDIQRIVQIEADLFGGLPYERYLFLLHLSGSGFGGLEHKTSCSLIYQRFAFHNRDKYDRFLQLVAHEFFHLWNVKRIRPKALEVFDYEQENYTPSLWFSEGTTSYYDLLIPYRAGLYDVQTYLRSLSQEVSRFLTTPGRKVQPLSEASFDAWIKLYRQDANSPNSQMSYYLKGEMVTLLLDLHIRAHHGNARSFDDVMRQMWQQFGIAEIGFTPEQLQHVIESIADADLSEFFDRYLHTTADLPFDDYLRPFGLRLQPDLGDGAPSVGMNVKTEFGREVVKFVELGSPAQMAGLDAGDELLALNGIRITAEQINDRLRDFHPGDSVEFTFFHQDELRQGWATLSEPRPVRYQIVPVEHPTAIQTQNFLGWLGVPLSEVI